MTKKLEAMVHTQASGLDRLDQPQDQPGDGSTSRASDAAREHDRRKPRLLPEDDPVLVALGISDAHGRVKPSRQAKYRQVEEFLRSLAPVVDDALASGRLRTPTAEDPLRVVDLGCGNAYLTFAAHGYLEGVRGLPVRVIGVDAQAQWWPATTRSRGTSGSRSGSRSRPATSAPPSSTSGRTWCWRCTPATPPPTTRWPGR